MSVPDTNEGPLLRGGGNATASQYEISVKGAMCCLLHAIKVCVCGHWMRMVDEGVL